MKAWYVTNKNDTCYSGIVFAETRGKAISYCMHSDVIGDDIGFTDVIAKRCKDADKFYNQKPYMDWDDEDDRILMVKELGFYCSDEYLIESDCVECSAREYCDKFREMSEEN